MKFVAGFRLCWLAVSLCAAQPAVVPSVAVPQEPALAAASPLVLSYAGVGTAPGEVSPEDFEREMLYLKETGATVLAPQVFPAGSRQPENAAAPLRAVMLAFADTEQEGFRSYALPVLQRCGFPYMVATEAAVAAGGKYARVTDDASFARAVSNGRPEQVSAVLQDVKACTPAVEAVPQNVVLPEFSDDDVAEDVSEEESAAAEPMPPAVPETVAPQKEVAIPPALVEAPLMPEEPAPMDPTPVGLLPDVLPAGPTESTVTAQDVSENVAEVPQPAADGAKETVPEPGEPAPVATCGVLGKRTPEGDWVTTRFKQPLVPRGQTRVAVLGYHNFSKTKPCTEMRMSTADFCRQMQFLKDSDICVISMQDFLEWRFGNRCLPERCVLITIDDGWKSVYTDAYPVLKAYGYPFTLYLYTRYINVQGDSMTSEQIKEMMAHGATIGSHSSNHLYPSKWKRYKQDSPEYAAQLEKELLASRAKLVDMFGNCSTYCYPGGYNTPAMHATLEASDYQAAFTVLESRVGCEEKPFEVHRYMVFGTNHEIFRRAVTFGGQEAVAATRAAIAAAEQPARVFFPAAFDGCTNRYSAGTAKKKAARTPARRPSAKPNPPQMVKDPSLPSSPETSPNVL